ncbi:MAG TPA: excinuclease ABC subunit UvrA, partial [Paludibacteraceae bacterium]|nr:excinuclease ABC subunit UvrA [Paludibacteraceae bacterium]
MEDSERIEVFGAREHNLKNIDVSIPRDALTVITGLSGSGKSSLAFDTIFAEGQRRYMDTFSAYARNFIGNLQRPDVDQITGLSPVISIEQKTTNKNPRSTVGTTTEIYDFFRLLFARASEAYSYVTGEKMVKYSEDQIVDLILKEYNGKKIILLAPVVRGRKGHYKELFEQIRKKGYLHVRIDEKIQDVIPGLKVNRYKNHDIEIVIDRLEIEEKGRRRLKESLQKAMQQGNGIVMILENENQMVRYFSKKLMCPTSGISYDDPDPHHFSFNSPHGACPYCKGLGFVNEIDLSKVIPNKSLSIYNGGIAPLGKYRNSTIFWQIEAILEKYGCNLKMPIVDIPEEALDEILNGTEEPLYFKNRILGTTNYFPDYNGIIKYLEMQQEESASATEQKWAHQYSKSVICPECNGARLKKESLFFRIHDKNIAELSEMDISELYQWVNTVEEYLSEKQRKIASEILKEIRNRLQFMLEVGLNYLSLNRSSESLSGGENQRIRLATQIGSQLVNVLYILDEPSIGLHQRDNLQLI